VKEHLDFIVIGAQKCGTTSLFEYLRRHPQLCLPAGKEAPFFSHDTQWSLGWDTYVRRNFGTAPNDRLWGTVSPHYMVGSLYEPAERRSLLDSDRPEAIVPQRIQQHSSDAKLIAILRDPVERARSHHRMEMFRGAEIRPFDDATAELLRPDALALARQAPTETTSYITTGEYGRILAPYHELFSRDQILVCFTSDLLHRTAAVVEAVFRFLGVKSFVPDNLDVRYRDAAAKRRAEWADLYRVQAALARNRAMRVAWKNLPPSLRSRASSTFSGLAYRLELWNRVHATPHGSPMSRQTELALRRHFQPDRQLLQELIGTEPPW
jgi:sulfotransferase family protein